MPNYSLVTAKKKTFTLFKMAGSRVVNGPTSSDPNPARTRKLIWSPNHARKNPKVKLGLKNLAIFPSYFDYTFVHLRQKACLRTDLSPKFLSTLAPNPGRTRAYNLQLWRVAELTTLAGSAAAFVVKVAGSGSNATFKGK